MSSYFKFISRLSRFIFWVSGIILLFMMMITVIDVILRYIGKSIPGTYELVSFAGALVVGLAIAQTSIDKAHVFVDIITEHLSRFWARVFYFSTKIGGGFIFLLIALSFLLKGNELFTSNEVSMTLHIPFYPVAYGLCICSVLESLVLFSEALKAIFFPDDI